MKDQSQEQKGQSLDSVDGACLIIECYSNGEVGFSCDWQEDDVGISCMATILIQLQDKNISDKILKSLQNMISTEDQEQQIEKINTFYSTLKRIAEQNSDFSDDDVVVYPIEAPPLI